MTSLVHDFQHNRSCLNMDIFSRIQTISYLEVSSGSLTYAGVLSSVGLDCLTTTVEAASLTNEVVKMVHFTGQAVLDTLPLG